MVVCVGGGVLGLLGLKQFIFCVIGFYCFAPDRFGVVMNERQCVKENDNVN